jgi:hypothetical protein
MEDVFLNDCWALYFHDPDNQDWSEKSYQLLHTVSSVQDWIQCEMSFKTLWQNGMFFLMREHIQPRWEDPLNKQGGCISFKVNKPEAGEYWFQLACKAIGEVLVKREVFCDKLCGVSISPKRNYCILRLWVSHPDASNPDGYNLESPHYSKVFYKPHLEQKGYEAK